MTDHKSIIDPKYRGKRDADWLATLITSKTGKTKDKVTKTKVEGTDPVEYVETTTQVADGIDIDKVFNLAAENGLTEKTAKFEAQRDGAGFAGRFRMTVRNMLQAVAKQRHGLMVNDEFVSAPADWLADKKAPASPTHTQDGTKIVVEKPKAAEPAAEDAAE